MDPSTISTNSAGTTCSGSFQLSSDNFSTCIQMSGAPVASNADKTFTITPASNLLSLTTYKVRVTTAAKDLAGNSLTSQYTQASGFTTEDATAPTISSTTPANSATSVSTSTTVAVVFSEAMNTGTISTNTADTTCSGSFQLSSDNFTTCVRMSAAPVASNGDKTFTITPLSSLSTSTTYKIRVTTTVQDVAGNPLATQYTQANGFTTTSPTKILRTLSSVGTGGSLGGFAGADTKCQTAYGASYKALIVANTGTPATTRIACTSSNCSSGGITENQNWVLLPNTTYVRSDGVTVIGTTNSSAIFTGTLTNTIGGGGWPPMTGIDSDTWQVYTGYTCSNWTSTSGNPSSGNTAQTSVSIAFGKNGTASPSTTCNEPQMSLFCVQQ